MKKVLLSIFCVFYVPVTAFLFRIFDPMDPHPHFNPKYWIGGLIYLLIIFYCLSFLLKNRPAKKSIFLSLLVAAITLGYGMPLDYLPQFFICLLAGIATALCFLQITSPEWHTDSFFDWKQKGWKTNLIIISIITVSCLALYSMRRGWVFRFSISGTLSALAAGVSEELIFRVFLPVLIYIRLKINDTGGNRFWIYLIISVLFSLIHLDYYDALDPEKTFNYALSGCFYAGAFTFLINKYGILYGIYAHCLWDFLVLNNTVG